MNRLTRLKKPLSRLLTIANPADPSAQVEIVLSVTPDGELSFRRKRSRNRVKLSLTAALDVAMERSSGQMNMFARKVAS